jgi:exodeoxyribonuclease V gamma subunit
MAQQPRRGDRSRRSDDRYLFLESLLSARSSFFLSYVGQSIKDNAPIPPSVLVDELLDYIESNYKSTGDIRGHVVTSHKLQAFNPDYFRKKRDLFSYSKENLQAAQRLVQQRTEPPPFFPAKLPVPAEKFRTVSLTDLYRFFRNPAQFLLNQRLGIYLSPDSQAVEDKESFSLRGLDRYIAGEGLLNCPPEGIDEIKSILKASGMLPHGTVGRYELELLESRISQFSEKTKTIVTGEMVPSIEIDLSIEAFRIVGQLSNCFDSGLYLYRYAAVRAKDYLNAWLNHLILNALPLAPSRNTVLAGVNTMARGNWVAWRFHPPENAGKLLQKMLRIYWEGLQRPVHFFPESSLEFAKQLYQRKKNEHAATYEAKRVWEGGEHEIASGERENLYFSQCFQRVEEPINVEFQRLAKAVWEPLLLYAEELT